MKAGLPPQNIEAERSLLGAILTDQSVILDVMASVNAEDFYRKDHQLIFEAMVKLSGKNQPIDMITVSDYLTSTGSISGAGGVDYIVSLTEDVPLASNAVQYAQIVSEKALQRRLIQASSEIAKMAYEPEGDVPNVLEEAEKKIFNLVQKRNNKSYSRIGELLPGIFDELTELSLNGSLPGIPTGFIDLDKLLAGLHNSDLILVAARPGMGKTALMLNLATNVAKKNYPVAVFNLEMSSEQLAKRILSSESQIGGEKIKTGQFEEMDWTRLAETLERFESIPLYIDDSTDVTIASIRAKCRKLKLEKDIKLIIIDYLQLMSSGGKSDNRTTEIAEISRALKIMAKELNVPVIVGSQLSREVEKRADKRPQLSDLRESGAIEQDADIVMFIYRDVVYNKDKLDERMHNIAELIIGKHRNGSTGTINLIFDGSHASFKNVTFTGERK
ncbi:MAG: replicative DNA helicase [Clostridia bacterium]|nr:replicative DNA helicase [Clostridia bacterium]